MFKLKFLGTGPTMGIKNKKGRSRRLESSALVYDSKNAILIDITRDFKEQLKSFKPIAESRKLIAVITHAHRDASGGIPKFDRWLGSLSKKITIYSLSGVINKLKKRYKTKNIIYKALRPFKNYQFQYFNITIFPVRHSIQKGYPTAGFKFWLPRGFKLVYISDTGGWSKRVQTLIRGVDLLVLDGAMWDKRMIAHLDMKEVLPKAKKWEIKRLIFTQIGRSAPKHEILKKEIKKIWPKAGPAYDGLTLILK